MHLPASPRHCARRRTEQCARRAFTVARPDEPASPKEMRIPFSLAHTYAKRADLYSVKNVHVVHGMCGGGLLSCKLCHCFSFHHLNKILSLPGKCLYIYYTNASPRLPFSGDCIVSCSSSAFEVFTHRRQIASRSAGGIARL